MNGTNTSSIDFCDQKSGKCRCLPNVIGNQCDQCLPDHWGLNSGTGCIPCGCDTSGTRFNSTSCDAITGICDCDAKRTGRTCNSCPDGYWGTPKNRCFSKKKIKTQ